jgi:hypothetical protein
MTAGRVYSIIGHIEKNIPQVFFILIFVGAFREDQVYKIPLKFIYPFKPKLGMRSRPYFGSKSSYFLRKPEIETASQFRLGA